MWMLKGLTTALGLVVLTSGKSLLSRRLLPRGRGFARVPHHLKPALGHSTLHRSRAVIATEVMENELRLRSPELGIPLHWMEVGYSDVSQTDEPVIILHGLLGNSMNFNTWAKDLFKSLDTNRRIIIPDLRNHGQSSHVSSMNYRELMEDVLRLMDDQGIAKAEFIGHSLGGKIASGIALCHPERVKSLAVLDIAPVKYSEEDASWWQVDSVVDAMASLSLDTIRSREEANELLKAKIDDPILRRFALTNIIFDSQANIWKWRINIHSIKKHLQSVRDYDIGQGNQNLEDLGLRYEGEVFFVSGRRSKYIGTRHLPTIAKLFPKYRMVTLKNAGHWVHSEAPEETVKYCKIFLDRGY